MADLNDLICDFNLNAEFKLLQPFEESEIAKTVYDLGFKAISERDWGELVVYR